MPSVAGVIASNGKSIVRDSLALYLDANFSQSYPGTGTTWNDISGNGRNFTWFSTPTFTTGQQNYFTTLGNRCTGPASNSFGINNTSGYTIFLIMMQNALINTSAFKFYSSNGTGVNSRGIFAHATWGDDNVYFDQGSCCNADSRTFVASGGSQTWNIWTFRRLTGSSTRSIHKNGITLTTNTATAIDINLSATAADVSGTDENGGNSSTWNARLNSFIVYNRGLSDEEISQNFNAFRGRFDI